MSPSLHLVSILKQFALAFQIINQINYPIKMSREQKEVHEKINTHNRPIIPLGHRVMVLLSY